MRVGAVVLAGGEGLGTEPAPRYKGLTAIAGRPMIAWVVDALDACETVSEIAVVVPDGEDVGEWGALVDHLVVSDASFMDNALAGLSVFDGQDSVLVVTGDVPALTAAGVDDFVFRSVESGAAFSYPLVSEADMQAQFPGSVRSYVAVDGEKVTGGNMMLVTPEVVRRARDLGELLFEARKSPVALARILGGPFVVRYATGRLRVLDVERKMGDMLGVKCTALHTREASIGADVDKAGDVVLVERVLYSRTSGSKRGSRSEL
jgi:molybdopterin-guanine dinucleotide biosynthesis protein A